LKLSESFGCLKRTYKKMYLVLGPGMLSAVRDKKKTAPQGPEAGTKIAELGAIVKQYHSF
jgi:hypothetical protein